MKSTLLTINRKYCIRHGQWWLWRGAALLLATVAILTLIAHVSPLLSHFTPKDTSTPLHAKVQTHTSLTVKAVFTALHITTSSTPKSYHLPTDTSIPLPAIAQTHISAAVKPSSSSFNITSTSIPNHSTPITLPLVEDLYEAGHVWPHPELCPSLGAQVKILILIASSPSHSQARRALRMTWGHFALRSDVALAFVIGSPPEALKESLLEEDGLYGDIILGRFVDSYRNLTLKTLSMLEWADTYCPRARYVLKTDDDMFINVPKLFQFVASPKRANATKTIWGTLHHNQTPFRGPQSKYYLSQAQFPGTFLPDFCTGPAYLLTADCVKPLYETALNNTYLYLEDVFITGVLADMLNIRRINSSNFNNEGVPPNPCAIQKLISIHKVQYYKQFEFWKQLFNRKIKCASKRSTKIVK